VSSGANLLPPLAHMHVAKTHRGIPAANWDAPVLCTRVYVSNCANSRLMGLVQVERLAKNSGG